MSKLDRRSFLKKTGTVAGAAATATLAAPAIAAGVKELKMVTSWPRKYPGLGMAAYRFAKRFEAATDGRYKIKLYGGGEYVPALKCLDAVQEGAADLYHSAEYYYQGKSKALAFFTSVPFGFRADEMDAWLHHGGGQKLWDETSAQFGVKPFACGNTGSQMGGWFKKPINSTEDFKGLKMRIPGLGGDVLAALGGTPVTLAGIDILPSLQSGAIDASEWVGPYNDLAFGLYKVAKHYYYPGFHEPGPTLSLGVGLKLWEGMSVSDKTILEACALAENNYDLAEFNAKNATSLDVLINRHKVQVKEFSDEIFIAIGEASKGVLAQAGNSDPLTKKVYESYMAFRKLALTWSEYSDQAYMRKRALVTF